MSTFDNSTSFINNLNDSFVNTNTLSGDLPIINTNPGILGINNTTLKYILCFVSLVITFGLSWAIPTIFQMIFRKVLQLEIHFKKKDIRNRLYNYYHHKHKSLKDERPVQIGNQYPNTNSSSFNNYYKGYNSQFGKKTPINGHNNNQFYNQKNNDPELGIGSNYDNGIQVDKHFKKKYHGVIGYLRKNLFLCLYFSLKMCIIVFGVWFSFEIVGKDILLFILSFGSLTILSMLSLNDYVRNLVAHFMTITTAHVKEGDMISFPMWNVQGIIYSMGFFTTILYDLNPVIINNEHENNENEIGDQNDPLIKHNENNANSNTQFIPTDNSFSNPAASILLGNYVRQVNKNNLIHRYNHIQSNIKKQKLRTAFHGDLMEIHVPNHFITTDLFKIIHQ